jgi:hypothetical protein
VNTWRGLVLLVGLLAAGCAPVALDLRVTPAAANGVILPEQAQRAIDAYTATARVEATQDAQATATRIAAGEMATAARQSTRDALEGQQTQAALQMTQAAATSAQADTAQARTQAAHQTQAWATPTAAAMRTQAAAAAIDYARQQAQASSVGEFWQTVRFVIVALLIVGGLTSIAVVVVDRLASIRVQTLREKAAIAREAFRILPPGHWAEWQPGAGYQVYTLPGHLDAPATIIENARPTPNRAHEWRQAVRLFCWWGDRYGFGIREIGPAPTGAGVVSDPDWRILSKMLKGAGVLAEVSIPGKKGNKTAWAPEWGYPRLHDELGHGRLALPFPTEGDAPKVAFTVPNTTPQNGQHNTATQKGLTEA